MSDDVCVKSMEQFTILTFSDACREIANNPYSPMGGQVLYNHSRKSELPVQYYVVFAKGEFRIYRRANFSHDNIRRLTVEEATALDPELFTTDTRWMYAPEYGLPITLYEDLVIEGVINP